MTLNDVSFAYDTHTILSDVSLTVHSGDYLTIVGENGSGKTTLINIILGLLKPSHGSIVLGTSRIGYVPQNATHVDPLFPVTAGEVVRMGITERGIRAQDAAHIVKDALTHVSLLQKIDMPLATLSGGERQRVMVARALATNPDVLILDEPTVGISKDVQDAFYALLHELNTTHCKTIILVTHDRGRATHDATHVVCVEDGKLHYHAEPHTIAQNPFNHNHTHA